MNDKHDKSKNPFFDNIFLNVDFSITIADTDFKFSFPILHICLEGTMSQISYLCLSFDFMSKIGYHFRRLCALLTELSIFKTM